MIGTGLLMGALSACLAPDGERADDPGRWEVVEIARAGQMSVRLAVMKRASLGDEAWMVVELENRGEKTLQVRSAAYRIKRESFDLETGKPVSSGSLASGDTYALFPEAWDTPRVAPILLKPGVTRISQQPSDYSLALLRLPAKSGVRVKARVFFSAELDSGVELRSPERGVPLEFDWVYPDEDGFARARRRLRRVLESPMNRVWRDCHLLEAFLDAPPVAEALSVDELIAAVDWRDTSPFQGRETIVSHLAERHAENAAVIAFYRERIAAHDAKAIDDLRGSPEIWGESLVELLVDAARKEPKLLDDVVVVFDRWHTRGHVYPAVAKSLSGMRLARSPLSKTELDEMTDRELRTWDGTVKMLGLTHDAGMVPVIRPFLDDKTRLVRSESSRLASYFGVRPPPLRACDVALDAILTILDGSADPAYGKAVESLYPRTFREAEVNKRRDEIIITLKERLSGRAAHLQMAPIDAASPSDESAKTSSIKTERRGDAK
ncbi:MAG: hypothetical protein ACYTG0_21110 [Planctomycetota bacterium]|jgi:hypothetical protein